MFNKSRKFKNTFAPPDQKTSLLDHSSAGTGNLVELSTFWKNRLLKIYTFSASGSIYLSSKESKNTVVAPQDYRKANTVKLIKITKNALECYPVSTKFSYYSKKKEVPLSALLGSSQFVQGVGQNKIFLHQGDLLCLESEQSDFKITVSYKQSSVLAESGKLINMSLSEISVLALSFVALLFLFLYNHSVSEPEIKDKKIAKTLNVVFKKFPKSTFVEKNIVPRIAKKSRAIKKHKKKRILIKSRSRRKTKKLLKKGSVFIAKRAKKNTQSRGRKTGGIKSKKVNVNSVGLLGVFAKSGLQKKIAKTYTGSGGLYGLAKSKRKGDGGGLALNNKKSFGSGLKGKVGGSASSTVKVGGDFGSYGSANGVTGGSVYLGGPSKVSVSYGNDLGDNFAGGSIDSSAIYRVIQAHKNIIRFCYQKEQDYYPDLKGLVRLHWMINDKGRVVNAKIKNLSTNAMAGVGRCIIKNLKSWQFPKAPKSRLQAIEFPFRFKKK